MGLNDSDLFVVQQGELTKSTTAKQFATYISDGLSDDHLMPKDISTLEDLPDPSADEG